MNHKIIASIGISLLFLSVPSFAADDTTAELRAELNALTQRLNTLEKKKDAPAKASWTDKIKVKGDLRYRFQFVEAEETDGTNLSTRKNIQRIRARLGVYADVNEFTKAAIGVRTGKKANTGNITLSDQFDGLAMSLSLAYLSIAPEKGKYGMATFGKMKQPWKNTTDLIWDSDVNPEGIAYAYDTTIKSTELIGSLGYFRLVEEKAKSDFNMGSAQLGLQQDIGAHTALTFGGSFYGYDNATEFTDPVLPGNYAVNYRIAEGFIKLAIKDIGPVPFSFFGNYVNNTAISTKNEGYCIGFKLGNAKKGSWEAKYDYRDLGLYAAPAYFTDSDFADGGTGVKGHRIKAKYNFAKNLAAGATYIYSLRTPNRSLNQDQQFNTLMLDLMVKF